MASSASTIVLLTGANGGLGLAILQSLCESTHTYHILVGCRSAAKAETAIATTQAAVAKTTSTLEGFVLDSDSDESIASAVQTVGTKFGRLDVLINNSGTSFDNAAYRGEMSKREAWTRSWAVNVTSPYLLTEAFAPLLIAAPPGARLLFMTSGTSSMTETKRDDHPVWQRLNTAPPAGWPKQGPPVATLGLPAYRSSKTGLNMVMCEWARVLRADGVKTFSISPGFLATGFGGLPVEAARKMGAAEPSVGGNLVRDVVEGKWDDDVVRVARVWPSKGVQPW